MVSLLETQVVLLTPAGRGAVASLLVAGPKATETVGRLLHLSSSRELARQSCGKILLGRWQSRESGEEVVVCRRSPQRVEIHCHGGHVAAATLIASLVASGCREIDWQAWLSATAADPIEAPAQIALTAAPTQRTAAILWDQCQGALRRAVDEIAALLRAGNRPAALRTVESLRGWSRLGCHLVVPWRVVLAGRPNVGKSSLINALVGFGRTIVHETPGTTRDVVTATTAIDGWPIELADTAGLHASTEPIEAAGIRLAQSCLATADLVVLVFDASKPWGEEEEQLERAWPTALKVLNKSDLPQPSELIAMRAKGLWTSATTGQGIESLQRALVERLVPQVPTAGQGVPFTAGHAAAVEQIEAAVRSGQTEKALELAEDESRWAAEGC